MTDQIAPSFSCTGCGARVEYAPGTTVLRCPYCGHEQQVGAARRDVREHPVTELAQLPPRQRTAPTGHAFTCQKCGARTESDALSDLCQFCGAPLVADAGQLDRIPPEAVLPFELDRDGARKALRGWVSSRWFAPGKLKRVTEAETLKGTYLPHWTYDARTRTDYLGERGDYYYETETYTETVNGQQQTRTRQVRRTRWRPASGTVRRDFDDLLVPGTRRLDEARLGKLGPWPLTQSVAYQPDYLAGYQSLRYEVEPEEGLVTAKAMMEPVIRQDCRDDIGGDEQRVHTMDTRYEDVTFKLMLLPVWLAGYLYGGRSWQVMVNARTGEVLGERPYSAAKITAAILVGLALIAAIIVAIVLARH